MTGRARAALLLVTLGGLAWWSPASSQDDAERDERREQIRQTRALLVEARDGIAAGDHELAEARLREILELDAANADAHYLLGGSLLSRGDTAAAATLLESGVQLAPFSTRLKLLLARVYIAGDRAAEAGTLLDGVLQVRPRDPEVLYVRGLAHLAAGDSVAALGAMRASLAVSAGGPEP